MPSYSISIPASYDRTRPHLILFSVYACVAATLLLISPQTLLELPLLGPIENLTGLSHLATPSTPNEKQLLALAGALGSAIAMIYTVQAGPAYYTTGRVWAEGSILTRLGFASVIWAICLFTPHGNSFIFVMSMVDATSAVLTKYTMGLSFAQLLSGRRPEDKKD